MRAIHFLGYSDGLDLSVGFEQLLELFFRGLESQVTDYNLVSFLQLKVSLLLLLNFFRLSLAVRKLQSMPIKYSILEFLDALFDGLMLLKKGKVL